MPSPAAGPGEQLVGGGASTGFGERDFVISASGPDAGNPHRWFIRALNNSTGTQAIEAQALCASHARCDRVRMIELRQATVSSYLSSFDGNAYGIEVHGCGGRASDLKLSAGGFLTSTQTSLASTAFIDFSHHGRARWFAGATDVGGNPFDLTAYSYCAGPARRDHVRRIRLRTGMTEVVPSGGTTDAVATCDSGERVVAGGAIGGGTGPTSAFLNASAPDPSTPRRTWLARASTSPGAPARDITTYAYCASA